MKRINSITFRYRVCGSFGIPSTKIRKRQSAVTALQCNRSKTSSTTKANIQTKVMSCQCPYSMGVISLKHRNYKFRLWVELIAVQVLSGEFLRGVGVAVFALVRTSVVLPDVLAHHAATGSPIYFVLSPRVIII